MQFTVCLENLGIITLLHGHACTYKFVKSVVLNNKIINIIKINIKKVCDTVTIKSMISATLIKHSKH